MLFKKYISHKIYKYIKNNYLHWEKPSKMVPPLSMLTVKIFQILNIRPFLDIQKIWLQK